MATIAKNFRPEAASRPAVDGAQSIRRALTILDVLATGRDQGVRLIDVTRRTGLNKPTVHRILRVLVEEGVVEQNDTTRRYAIGVQIGMLALARSSRSPLLRAAEPLLQAACDKIGDTIFLTIRIGLDTLCVARRLGRFPVQVLMIDRGERRPLGMSSAGLAMLAALGQDEVESIIARNGERLASYRMSPARALGLVTEARENGYVLRNRGLVPGTKVISVVVPASPVSPLAAISVAGVDRRMGQARIPEIAEFLVSCVKTIETSLSSTGKRSMVPPISADGHKPGR